MLEPRNTNPNSQSALRYIDWFTIVLYGVLVVCGAVSIYAASYDFDHASIFSMDEFSGKQIMWIGISFVIAFIIMMIQPRMFEAYAYPIYLAVILLLIVTIFVARDINGSRSWIQLGGGVNIQPAEFAKFATALALARLFNTYNFHLNDDKKNYFKALAIILVPMILIVGQHETGSALVFLSLFFVLYREGMSGLVLLAAISAVVFFVVSIKYTETLILGIPTGQAAVFIMIMVIMVCLIAVYCRNLITARNVALWFIASGVLTWILKSCGVEVKGYVYFIGTLSVACLYCLYMLIKGKLHNAFLAIGAVVASVVFLFSVNYAFNDVLRPFQQQRIKVVLGIEEDLRGVGYNVNQSKIAIGSGGVAGKGFLNGTQTKLKYVPEQHTDFIYCTIGEEEGFIGSAAVLLLFLILIYRIIAISERQPTAFGRVYGYCVASYFILHLCINIGMVIGLCPVIGIPLPFFSYGGSSLVGFTILIFILLRIDSCRKQHLSY